MVLADDQQIVDLIRFCTASVEFGVITVDPTFCLGAFDVTPMTYRHLLLETCRNSQPPIFLGPVLIHYKKTFSSYLFFASSLIGLNRQLEGVRVIGTDGERALSNALTHEFRFAQHLTCFIHVRRNIKNKINECNLPSRLANTILNDVFGQRLGSVYQEGLVDSVNSDDYDNKLQAVIGSWRNAELQSTSDIEKFIDWFMANKPQAIRQTMLRSIREDCGLGNPPSTFSTNASESINALLKHKVDYQKQQLPMFIEKVQELVAEQKQEVERAVVNRGKWRLRSQYRYLGVQEQVWFTMTAQQRQRHLSWVHSVSLMEADDTSSHSNMRRGDGKLSMDAETLAKSSNLPIACVEGILNKASELLHKENAIVPAPGQSSEARMVLSFSSKMPHMVVPTKGSGFSCDNNCSNWKSIGLCSHSVAVAESNGKLEEFIMGVKRKKKIPNMTALATSTMPKGRGRKGSIPPHTRKSTCAAESCTRVSMNVGTQVVSGNIGTASTHATPNVPTCVGDRIQDLYSSPLPPNPWNHPYPLVPCRPSYSPPFTPPYFPPSYPCPSFSPVYSPSMYSSPSYSPTKNPFTLGFIRGNISVCIGCKNRYEKNAQPPNDLCIKHQEWREFTPVGSETTQSKFCSVCYHCNVECVQFRCADFNPLLLWLRNNLRLYT